MFLSPMTNLKISWFYQMITFKKRNQVIGYYENNEFIGFVYLVLYKIVFGKMEMDA